MTATATGMFRGRGGGGRGEGNCGGGGSSSGDGGGNNGDKDNGGSDNENDISDDNDDGCDDKDDDISDEDNNGGDGGGGCNTATAVGKDRQVNNQLKAAINTGRRGTRGGGRGHGQRHPWFINVLVSFFYFAFCEECGLGTTQSVRKSFFSRQELGPVFTVLIKMAYVHQPI